MSPNESRRSFLRKTAGTGIGSIGVLTAASTPVLACADEGDTWEDHNHERVDVQPYAGNDYREWIDVEQWLGIRYNGLDWSDGRAEFDILAIHSAVYGDNTQYEMDYEDRKSLLGMDLAFVGRNGTVTHGADNVSSDVVRGFTPKHEQEVLDSYDISQYELNDADAVQQIDELQQEYTADVLESMTNVSAALVSTFGAGAVAVLGKYVAAAMLVTGTLDALTPPSDNEKYEVDGELYEWGFEYQSGTSTAGVGVTHYKGLEVEENDQGVLDLEVQMTTRAQNDYMYSAPVIERDLEQGAGINYRYC